MRSWMLKVVILCLSAAPVLCQSSEGKEFWFGFLNNYSNKPRSSYTAVNISSSTDAIVHVSVPRLNWYVKVEVKRDSAVTVDIPKEHTVFHRSGTVDDKAVHIISDQNINVVALNYERETADAALIYPVASLGTDYLAIGYTASGYSRNEILVVSTRDSTIVFVTYAVGRNRVGSTDTFNLDSGQTIQLSSRGDLTGTSVKSMTYPIAVFSGVDCADVPVRSSRVCCCDHLYEQVPPLASWGTKFVTIPYQTRRADSYRFLASKDSTDIFINGNQVLTLAAGRFKDTIFGNPSVVTSSKPIMVAQFSNGQFFDGKDSDPFMVLLSPAEHTRNAITFGAFKSRVIKNYYLNVVLKSEDVPSLILDGDSSVWRQFTYVDSTKEYMYAQLDIEQGRHTLKAAGAGFNAYVYGYGNYESFGYNAGTRLDSNVPIQPTNFLLIFSIVGGVLVSAGGGYYFYRKQRAKAQV